MAGKSEDRIAAPMVFSGTADSELFEHWFEYCFCPEVSGNIAVLDNASIHRKKKVNADSTRLWGYFVISTARFPRFK